jgi:hypothetical protein
VRRQGGLVGVVRYDSSRHNMPFMLGYGPLRFFDIGDCVWGYGGCHCVIGLEGWHSTEQVSYPGDLAWGVLEVCDEGVNVT